jgi:hypothetical protein
MSKNASQLKTAIQGLNIKKPFDLRTQSKPALKAPAQVQDAQHESAHSAQATPQGFFMLAHSVFQNPIIRELSGDAFRIFIWMSSQAWRFRESNGQFRAAVDYIVAKCGCSRSTVTRGLADLKLAKLIECVEQNFKKGNLWQVSRIADGRNEQAEIEPAQNEKEAGLKSGGSMPKLSREHAQNEHHLITSLEINKNSEEGAAFQNELKTIWKEFRIQFSSIEAQNAEILLQLKGQPFGMNQPFARDLAVLKWWESKNARL